MTRTVIALVSLLGCASGSARAETLPLFEGIPTTYTPGVAFQFTVRVPGLADFTGYNVDLVFGTNVPNPPLFVSSQAPAVAPDGRYVFPSKATFQSGTTLVQDSPEIVLTFTDTTGSPVVAQPGVNDTLAVVTVIPGATLTGPITITIGGETGFSANLETNYPFPDPITIDQAPGGPSPVPAPAGAVLLGLGGLLLGARNRLTRNANPARSE